MRYGTVAYMVTVVTAVVLQYAIELYLPFKPFFGSWTLVPWTINILSYTILGGIAWHALRSHSIFRRMAMLSLVAILPRVLPELLGQTDPAYSHIGLLFIVPDLLWVALGAAIAALLTSKMSTANTSS